MAQCEEGYVHPGLKDSFYTQILRNTLNTSVIVPTSLFDK